MAEYRQVHTQIWRDDWFLELSPNEKLIFIYLFSNENTNLAGIYKLSLRHANLETGLTIECISEAMHRFESDRKVVYRDGYIWVKNLRKYNASRSPKADLAIEAILKQIPDCAIKQAYIAYYSQNIPYGYHIDTALPSHIISTQYNTTQYMEEIGAPLPPDRIASEVYGPTNDFDSMKESIEALIGYMIKPTQPEVDAINAMVAEGITSDDLNAAVAFFKSKGKVARGAASLLESARYNKAQRTQAKTNGKPRKIDDGQTDTTQEFADLLLEANRKLADLPRRR